jgi:hypothetical protein
MFSLEKLKVYDRALASLASLSQHSARWERRQAVVDQLLRASESVVLNIAHHPRKSARAGRPGSSRGKSRPHIQLKAFAARPRTLAKPAKYVNFHL